MYIENINEKELKYRKCGDCFKSSVKGQLNTVIKRKCLNSVFKGLLISNLSKKEIGKLEIWKSQFKEHRNLNVQEQLRSKFEGTNIIDKLKDVYKSSVKGNYTI